jgi:hypothetical protein
MLWLATPRFTPAVMKFIHAMRLPHIRTMAEGDVLDQKRRPANPDLIAMTLLELTSIAAERDCFLLSS